MIPLLRQWTVWQFRGVSIPQTAVVARPSRWDDTRYQHEYQRVLGQVMAYNEREAIRLVTNGSK